MALNIIKYNGKQYLECELRTDQNRITNEFTVYILSDGRIKNHTWFYGDTIGPKQCITASNDGLLYYKDSKGREQFYYAGMSKKIVATSTEYLPATSYPLPTLHISTLNALREIDWKINKVWVEYDGYRTVKTQFNNIVVLLPFDIKFEMTYEDLCTVITQARKNQKESPSNIIHKLFTKIPEKENDNI